MAGRYGERDAFMFSTGLAQVQHTVKVWEVLLCDLALEIVMFCVAEISQIE